jgi:hypothetical protein
MDTVSKPSRNLYRSWLTIWYAPGKTIRQIADLNPEFAVYFISALYAFLFTRLAVSVHSQYSEPMRVHGLNAVVSTLVQFIFSLALVMAVSRIFLYALSACIDGISRAFGGKASYLAAMGALGWSLVPGLLVGCFLIILPFFQIRKLSIVALLGMLFLMLIWQVVILVSGMMAIQNFSIARAVTSVVLGIALALLAISGCVVIFSFGLQLLPKAPA